jgi:hypothetical protein
LVNLIIKKTQVDKMGIKNLNKKNKKQETEEKKNENSGDIANEVDDAINQGKNIKQGIFLIAEENEESDTELSNEIETATADQRFRKLERKSGKNEKRKDEKDDRMANFKKGIRKENKLKEKLERKKQLKKVLSIEGTSNFLIAILKAIFSFLDGILNFILTASVGAGIILSVYFIYTGNYIMVVASCIYLLTSTYISGKIQ